MASGQALIDLCKTHLLETLAALPECGPDGDGLGQKAIEDACGFALDLPEQDGWFTWSLLLALVVDGKVESFHPTGARNRRYRLMG